MSRAMFRETHTRSIAKAISWRILGSVATMLLVLVFTRRLALSLAVGGIEFVSKIGLFWLHERAWDRLRFGKREITPAVVWLTGLSGAGKSTIAAWVADALRGRGFRVECLDGDAVRAIFPQTGFTRAEREEHLRRVGYLAGKLEQNGVFVVASFVSPYESSRQFVRGLCKNFVEVFVSTPLAECERRDIKGLYARARRGELKNFTGIDDPFEVPSRPEVTVDTSSLSVSEAGERVLEYLDRRHLRG
jgi:adenylylsulfate kinase